jgi:mono/diheme cytochrome c family protein
MGSVELAKLLAHPDAWWRDTAQQAIVELRGTTAVPALEEEALQGQTVATRIAALWTLDGLAATTPQLLQKALLDPSAKVRSAAVRLHERWLGGPDEDPLVAQLATVLNDPAPEVSVQLALSLGQAKNDAALELMSQVLLVSGDHPYVPSAIATGLRGRELGFFERLAGESDRFGPSPEAKTMLRMLVTAIVHQGDGQQIGQMIARVSDAGKLPTWFRLAVLSGFEPLLQPAFRRSVGSSRVTQSAALAPLVASSDDEVKASATLVADGLAQAEQKAREREAGARPLTAEGQQLYDAGKVTYQICAACHQLNGGGLANLAPSLVDSYYVTANPEVMVRIVLNGKEGTPGFPGAMPPIGMGFTDEQIAGILTYVRNSWGLHEGVVSVATVAKSRKENKGRVADWSDVQLRTLEFDLSGGFKQE